MRAKNGFKAELVAPCGMNGSICMAYLRERKRLNFNPKPKSHRIIVNNSPTKIGNGHAIMEEKEAKKCHSCGVEMQYMGEIPFRTGGTSGAWIFLFDKIAQASEDTLPLYVYVCPKCRRTELFMDEKTFCDQLQIQHALRRDE